MPLGTIALHNPFIPVIPVPIWCTMPLPRGDLSSLFSGWSGEDILLLGVPSKGPATKTAFLNRWHSKITAVQCIGMLSDEGQQTIKLNKDLYTWRNEVTGEVVEDGLSVLYYIQQVIRPNVNIDIYKELS